MATVSDVFSDLVPHAPDLCPADLLYYTHLCPPTCSPILAPYLHHNCGCRKDLKAALAIHVLHKNMYNAVVIVTVMGNIGKPL